MNSHMTTTMMMKMMMMDVLAWTD